MKALFRAALLLLFGLGLVLPAMARVPSASDLGRVEVGYQAGILRIDSPDGATLFLKSEQGQDLQGIDSVAFLSLTDLHRWQIFRALGIRPRELNQVSLRLMNDYDDLPHVKVLALLGVLGSAPDGHAFHLAPRVIRRIRHFLATRLTEESDPKVRRMAVLSLALTHGVDRFTVAAVVRFLETSQNSWETFTTQQFFECHGGQIRRMGIAGEVRRRIAESGSPYAATIRI